MQQTGKHPEWWNASGGANYVSSTTVMPGEITITTGSCHLKVTRAGRVRWLMFGKGGRQRNGVQGIRTFKKEELLTALDKTDHKGLTDEIYAKRFSAELALPGLFIRSGNFLNIPGPGTGYDGDANISIYLNEALRASLTRFLK